MQRGVNYTRRNRTCSGGHILYAGQLLLQLLDLFLLLRNLFLLFGHRIPQFLQFICNIG